MQNFGSVLWYLRDFVDREPVSAWVTSLLRAVGLPWTFTFDAEHVTVINAGTIILLQVLVSARRFGEDIALGGGGLLVGRRGE